MLIQQHAYILPLSRIKLQYRHKLIILNPIYWTSPHRDISILLKRSVQSYLSLVLKISVDDILKLIILVASF